MNAINLVMQAGIVAKAVLGILLVFSLACWTIIFLKVSAFRRADRQDERFLRVFREGKNLANTYEECRRYSHSPLAILFREGYRELVAGLKGGNPGPATPAGQPETAGRGPEIPIEAFLARLSRMLRHASLREVSTLERSLMFLATTGNVAPFVGLFGTVWGIMDAFHSIGMTGSANLGAVAPGIAEALIATAAGIAVAIPGVMGYNYFLNRIKGVATRMDLFTLEFLGIAERLALRVGRG
ncbi:MAG: MotA/TolQ/ExbB proton channel family protein [candidate division NC10 bacterium]|nr:MotA/TolQ/ExbB proton channel family protein [candidate division NC10 bacterium]